MSLDVKATEPDQARSVCKRERHRKIVRGAERRRQRQLSEYKSDMATLRVPCNAVDFISVAGEHV